MSSELERALLLYYNLDAPCPECPKEKIQRVKGEDGTMVMQCLSKKCNWKVVIQLPILRDILTESAKLKLDRTDSIYNMLDSVADDNREQFNLAKERYDNKN